ncbi:glyoxylase I family protein [Arenibacter nanhaiticus]|uniref:Glyoxylase I family protein n=1 Tax=Arenibacter nanhaiticus TaxID=558155 RepID=A0A1M6LLE9_9FLAO|nr:VOC family protein [Arenibacter nanhaiticus]SHJ71983.1 glyoxylase I family protein [Arenibacter nanhaiticus]
MLSLNKVHHIAIIASDYERSKNFYIEVLGLTPTLEVYREERKSYKLDLALNGEYVLELFSFPDTPNRLSRPEAAGLRHLAFEVEDVQSAVRQLASYGVVAEPIRLDENTQKQFTFIFDPDDLPIELYQK